MAVELLEGEGEGGGGKEGNDDDDDDDVSYMGVPHLPVVIPSVWFCL
jgi:hypothetical protein